MKTRKPFTAIFFLLVFTTLQAVASDEYTQSHKKVFAASDATEVAITNKYGDVDIKNWNKNEVSIEVTITVKARNEGQAEEVFKDIRITLKKEGESILGITDFTPGFSHNHFSIDYEVYMPKDMNLTLANKYGSVFINEITQRVEAEVRYGSLRANTLSRGGEKPRSEIKLAYCRNSYIKNAGWLKLDLSYSDLEVESSTALMVLSKYSKLYSDVTNSLVVESKYDTYRLGSLDKLIISGAYGSFEANHVGTRIEAEVRYTDIEVEKVPADFDAIDIDIKYGEVEIGMAPEASYRLDAAVSYCDLDYPENGKLVVDEGHTSLSVRGIIGQEQEPLATVKIKSKYADVDLE